MSVDVLTLGEALVRFSVPAGDCLERASSFNVHVGGSEANVAVALGRLGRSTIWVSRLPEGPLGRRVAGELAAAGVDPSAIKFVAGQRMGLYFAELHVPPRRATVIYDRSKSAAAHMTVDDVPWRAVDSARVVHLSGITSALSDSCREMVEAVAERARQGETMLTVDINYRAKLWPPAEAAMCLERIAQEADVLICSKEDADQVFGLSGDSSLVLEGLAQRTGARSVILTLGADGAAWVKGDQRGLAPGLPVRVIDRPGAGDAFTAGVIDGLLDGDVPGGVTRGVVMAAIALTTKGDQLLTTREEIDGLLKGATRAVDR